MAVTKKKKIIIGAAVLVLLAIVIGASLYGRRGDFPEVQTAKVERRPILESKVTANGEVRPIQFINLTAEVAGRVTDVFVTEGQQVKKGTPLLKVDPTQQSSATNIQEATLRAAQADVTNQTVAITGAENAINNSNAALNTAQADLERSKVDKINAEVELKRNTDLVESGIVSKSLYDTAKMRYDQAVASVNSAAARVAQAKVQVRDSEIRVSQSRAGLQASEARVAQARAGLRSQADLLSKTTQYATINGVVVGPIVQSGTFALANFSSTPLLIIADMSIINVEVRVDETDIANVAVGQKAKIKVDALGEKELQGDVVEKAASAVTRSGQTIAQTAVAGSQEAKDFKVVIRLTDVNDELRNRLRPGMSATATITTDRKDNILAIPMQALVEREGDGKAAAPTPEPSPSPGGPKPVKENKKLTKGVFLVRNNRAVFAPVETGITGENDIEITKGLSPGDEIIIGPYRQLRSLKNDSQIKREDKTKKAPPKDNK
jgi:HlyD family secretion protein